MSAIDTIDQKTFNERFAKLLELQFEGFFMCRIATDPDPTNEQLGVSGYTMALVRESPLDQVIRLQADDDFVKKNLRAPAEQMGIKIGVDVKNVQYDGKPYEPGFAALLDAPVSLEGKNPPFDGPIFDSRNNIVGSDDNMMFVVNPFDLVIRGKGVTLRAVDYLNPAQPDQKIWQIEDPNTYVRRLPSQFTSSSTQVMSILRVFDQATYFNDRLRYLRKSKEMLEAKRKPGKTDPELETEIQELESRIYQIDFWGSRFYTKMAFQLTYDFRANGPQAVQDKKNVLRGTADTTHPWPVTFWFGGWDGDLLVGYMQGTLGIPFLPD
ncbi:MAG TPA: hypothetical protein VKM72_19185 [Thermoanaerobaculia bacterium]|nr:hypothetical protein [Thermoanaerobaculia bacterium]